MSTPKHIVAVAGLVSDEQGRVLMLRSPRGDWEFPGGQVEEGESLTDALAREVLEETGIRVAVGALVGVYSNVKSHIVMFDFLCSYVSGEPTCSSESIQVEWVAREKAISRVIRAPIQDRLRDMLEFDGQVVYRSYAFHADQVHTEYIVHEDRHL
ncbi:MAG: ADP-ribose pyrophosphatase [Capsulimonas sp.]|jgi:8-oxo-dGTP diphosphatase|nr:ADP-ribose pyrophosphatase [Capsulimonas sp.]